ncbi:MAG: tetratricopeptide repeat protein [Pirellulales bacterium]|nr:tetratricopeptide repeat protein [Pirellulales bacterium]
MLFPQNKTEAMLSGVLLLLVLVAFAPAFDNLFVQYDDSTYLFENPEIQHGLSAHTIGWAFTTSYGGNWHPLTWVAHTINWSLFRNESLLEHPYGSSPAGHHLVSIAIHALSSVILFLMLVRATATTPQPARRHAAAQRATTTVWPAAIVAALFALHPLRAESVAWAAELKDVLCTFFWLLSMAAYLAYARRPSVGRYVAIVLCFVLGLLSKQTIVSLPLVLLLLDYWPLARFPDRGPNSPSLARQLARLVAEKIPLFVLAALGSLAVYLAQSYRGATEFLDPVPLPLRLANGAVSAVIYLRQMFWPAGLACFYPYPREALIAGGLAQSHVLGAIAFVVVGSALAWWFGRRRRYLLVGWFWYLITLLPVIGIIQVGLQAHADRYTYMPSVGISLLVVWGLYELVEAYPDKLRTLGLASAAVVVGLLVVVTWRQTRVWHDDFTLFEHAAAVVPGNAVAHRNLGGSYFMADQPEQAIEHFERAIELEPGYAPNYRNLALAFVRVGRQLDAERCFRATLERQPDSPQAICNLATLYAISQVPELRRPGEALRLAQQAVQMTERKDPECLRTLSTAYAANGQLSRAFEAAQAGYAAAQRPGQEQAAQTLLQTMAELQARMQAQPRPRPASGESAS